MSQVGRLPLRGELIRARRASRSSAGSRSAPVKKVRIHRSKNRTIERDGQGRRRFSGSDNTASARSRRHSHQRHHSRRRHRMTREGAQPSTIQRGR